MQKFCYSGNSMTEDVGMKKNLDKGFLSKESLL